MTARSSTAPHLHHPWIKAELGLRQFRLRGLVKAGIEAAWACLTYNVQLWIRLRWRRRWAT